MNLFLLDTVPETTFNNMHGTIRDIYSDDGQLYQSKEGKSEICQSLCHLFNMSLTTSTVPLIWKKANVVPVFKKDNSSVVSNYRPISLLSVVDKTSKVSETSFVGSFTTIGKNSIISDNCVIENQVFIGNNVKIGDGTVIYPGVKILDDSIIGKNCIIHSSCSIGSDGFGFAPNEDGSYKKIPQTGNVIIGDHVEIGSNSTIDRATLGSTIINNGVKLDNQIQIAHNVEIGENTAIAAQSGSAGSTKIGKNCMIGGQVGIIGHIKIGDNVKIQAQAGVTSDIESNATITGTPAISYMNYNKSYVHFKNLPEIVKKIDKKDKW